MRRAIVVGSAGQDGRLLTERLESDGVEVVGVGRGTVRGLESLALEPVDLGSPLEVSALVKAVEPDEVYYLAAHHGASEERTRTDLATYSRSFEVHVHGLLAFLQALVDHAPQARLFYAASSLVFGPGAEAPFTEESPLRPDSAYAISKAAGVGCCRDFRERHGVFAAVGFLFNHESPLRPARYLTQKVVRAAVEIHAGRREGMRLGDLNARIDWGYAPDFVDAMVRILEQERPGDFVVATGELHGVRELLEHAFGALGLDWRDHVELDASLVPRQARPRRGDASKLRQLTGWAPSVDFPELVSRLVAGAREHGDAR